MLYLRFWTRHMVIWLLKRSILLDMSSILSRLQIRFRATRKHCQLSLGVLTLSCFKASESSSATFLQSVAISTRSISPLSVPSAFVGRIVGICSTPFPDSMSESCDEGLCSTIKLLLKRLRDRVMLSSSTASSN